MEKVWSGTSHRDLKDGIVLYVGAVHRVEGHDQSVMARSCHGSVYGNTQGRRVTVVYVEAVRRRIPPRVHFPRQAQWTRDGEGGANIVSAETVLSREADGG